MTKEQQVWAHEEGTPPHSLADYGSKEKASGSALVKPAFEGHQVELERNFSMLSALGLAFALLNSWTGTSTLIVWSVDVLTASCSDVSGAGAGFQTAKRVTDCRLASRSAS